MNLKESKEGIKKRKTEPLLSVHLLGGPLNTGAHGLPAQTSTLLSSLPSAAHLTLGPTCVSHNPFTCTSAWTVLCYASAHGTLSPLHLLWKYHKCPPVYLTRYLNVHVKSPCNITQSEHHTDMCPQTQRSVFSFFPFTAINSIPPLLHIFTGRIISNRLAVAAWKENPVSLNWFIIWCRIHFQKY